MKSKTIIHFSVLMLSLWLGFSTVGVVQAKPQSEPESFKCPDIPLLKDAPKALRLLSTNLKDEPLYLSDEYCMVLDGVGEAKYPLDFPSQYDEAKYKSMYISYHKVYRRLPNQQQQLYFVHLFLHIASQLTSMTGVTANEPLARALVWVKHENLGVWHALELMPDQNPSDTLKQLRALQADPPKAEDHPILVKLIEKVLAGDKILPDDEIKALTLAL